MDLLGLAAPKRSVHVGVDFDGGLDQVMSQLVQAYQERDAERGRALADLRAQLAQAHGSGPPALTVLAGRRRSQRDIPEFVRQFITRLSRGS